MSIRRASGHDLDGIRRLLGQLMRQEVDTGRSLWDAALRREDYFAWVADIDGAVHGFIDLFVLPDVPHGRGIGLINNLVVDDRYRGQGLGQRLLGEAVAQCRRHDAVELHVWTGFDNAPAIGLYRKLGFADRALLLELELKPRS